MGVLTLRITTFRDYSYVLASLNMSPLQIVFPPTVGMPYLDMAPLFLTVCPPAIDYTKARSDFFSEPVF